MLQNFFKVGIRHLRRNRVFGFINIFGLAVGLTCCMLLTLYIWHECSYDNYHPNIDRLYQVGTIEEVADGKEIRFQGCPHMLADQFRAMFPQVEATARIAPILGEDKTLLQVFQPGQPTRSFDEEKGYLADSGFFQLFKYDFVEGNPATAIDGPNSIVLSKEIADKLFPGQSALGRVVHVSSHFDGENDFTVTGVYRPMDAPSHIDARFFLSMYGGVIGQFMRTFHNAAANYFFVTYVLLKNGANPVQIEKQLPAFVDTYEGKDLRNAGFYRKHFLVKVKDIHLHANMDYGDVTPSGSVTYLYILASIGIFTLLIACINFMNLATARASKRSGEVGVRKTLGAPRASLVRQFLGESVLLALFAFVLSVGLCFLLFPSFEHLAGKHIGMSISQEVVMGSSFLGLALVAGLLAGFYPALYLSSFQPVKVLKGKMSSTLSVVALRKGLVVFQFGISITLIVAALIIGQQMHYLRTVDLGFTKDKQIILPLRTQSAQKLYTPLKAELTRVPGVVSVGGTYFYPGFVGWNGMFYAEGKTKFNAYNLYTNIIDYDFLLTMGITIVAGRSFSPAFPSDSLDAIIVNEDAVRGLGWTPAAGIGKRIYHTWDDKSYRVVGVMKDFHIEDLHQPMHGVGFYLNSGTDFTYLMVHLGAGSPDASIASIGKVWHHLDPNEPFEYTFLDDEFQQHYDADNRVADLVGYAMGLAILISCLGLFGLTAFSVEQRMKEISIRKVLGARVDQILVLVSGGFLGLVALGALIGCPVGWYVTHRWLQGFAFKTAVTWTVFAATVLAALAIALVTISFQAVRAARENPVKNLRAE